MKGHEAIVAEEQTTGKIINIDRFGNLVTNVPAHALKKQIEQISLNHVKIKNLAKTYSDAVADEPIAFIGSHGYLEISVKNANAAKLLKIEKGTTVKVSFAK